ncbi:MAG: threonylcarbamoyl-AMP synthase [Alphaproteobacteria bacterium]|nr:threonylcarbamoyl-AMP synthase [Alphaproteobacteria bacterium]
MKQADTAGLAEAARLLCEGKLVAFPTETVYGLGGNALDDKAVAAIFACKGRPQFNPLIVHVDHMQRLHGHVVWNDTAKLLAAHFWPGALTLVVERSMDSALSYLVSAGLSTVAVRIPAHTVAQALLSQCGIPVAAPSANASGMLSPTTPLHVAESLGSKVDLILMGGKTTVGVESTVVDTTTTPPRLLRHGGLPYEKIVGILPDLIDMTAQTADEANPGASPGMLLSHYAPRLPLRMNATQVEASEALLAFGPDHFIRGGYTRLNLSKEGDLNEAAANLFAMLHTLDKSGAASIAVCPIPETGLGMAINDRLRRATIR